jgi:hypothetical protein
MDFKSGRFSASYGYVRGYHYQNSDEFIEVLPDIDMEIDYPVFYFGDDWETEIEKIIGDITEKHINEVREESDEILPNGTYRFDVAFAEWGGKSMGEKVTVVINGNSIQIFYEGDGAITGFTKGEKGQLWEEGIIMKHKSGVWIIGQKPSDTQLDEVGGCTGGPAIIDFKNKKYWIC